MHLPRFLAMVATSLTMKVTTFYIFLGLLSGNLMQGYNLRNSDFKSPRFNTIAFGKHFIKYLSPYLWRKIPITEFDKFKRQIRKLILPVTWRKRNVGGNALYVALRSFVLCIYELFIYLFVYLFSFSTVNIWFYCCTYISFYLTVS